MKHHYLKKQLVWFWMLLFCFWWSSVFSQTPKPNIVLSETETGTKDYQARDYVRLTPGFSYVPATGQSFKARINTTLSFKTFNNPNPLPGQTTGGGTTGTYVPGGSFGTDPVTQITGPVIKIQKAGATPGTFVTQEVFTYPVMWFKTVPTVNNLNGEYRWLDVCDVQNPAKLKRYATQGEGAEFTLTREKMRAYNFYPSMDISYEAANKVIAQNKTNLAQSTIIGAWGATDNFYSENFMFAVKGRIKDTLLVSNSRIAHINPEISVLAYSSETEPGFLYRANNDSSKYRERALRVGSFYRATQPNNTVWGESAKADIVLGGKFDATVVNPTTKFANDWTSLPVFKGSVPELLVFDRQLSEIETGIFESYLALKYGITMNKDYRSGNGSVIWNKNENVGFNNRVIGYGREDALGFDQKMSTTSHEEKPFYTDLLTNDAYEDMNSYNLSSRNRLLVAGTQPGNTLNDGEYIVIGDNSEAIATENRPNGYVGTMQRKWRVMTNTSQFPVITETLNWEINNLTKTDITNQKTTFLKYGSGSIAQAKSNAPLRGGDGYLAWTVEQEYGPITVGFGTNDKIATNEVDMGYHITTEGHVKLIKGGAMVNDSLFTVQKGQRIEVEKRGNILFMRINGVRYRNTEFSFSNANPTYYGAIIIHPSTYDIKISNVCHGGFVDTGHKLELSYNKATEFAPYRKGKAYLLITRDGQENSIVSDEVDESRMKIIFNNIYWENNDQFTFAYKGTSQQGLKKKDETIEPDYEFKNDIRVYYKDPADRSNVTVRVETARPSAAVITVYDMSGRRMYRTNLPEGCDARYADLHIEMRGMYIVKVITNDKEYAKKVMVN